MFSLSLSFSLDGTPKKSVKTNIFLAIANIYINNVRFDSHPHNGPNELVNAKKGGCVI